MAAPNPNPNPTTVPITDDLARHAIFSSRKKDIYMCQTIKLWIKK